MVKILSDLVDAALNKCVLSLGKGFEQPTQLGFPILTTQLLMIEIFTFLPCNLRFCRGPNILNYIGRTLFNFMVIVRCNPNFDLMYCWQQKRLDEVAVYKFHSASKLSPHRPKKNCKHKYKYFDSKKCFEKQLLLILRLYRIYWGGV